MNTTETDLKIITTAALCVAAMLALTGAPSAAEPTKISELSHIHGVAFDPSEPGSFFLATHHGVFKARADGTAIQLSADTSDYMGFTPDPGGVGRLLASGHPATGGNLGVIVSIDGGTNWMQLSTGASGPVDFHAMTISRADPKTIYGLYGDIQVSHDGGTGWLTVGSAPKDVIDLAASATDPNLLFAGTMSGLVVSKDGAKSWQQIGPANVPASLVEAASDGSLYVFFAGAGLFKQSADGSWGILAENLGYQVFLHLAADPADATHLLAVTQDSAVLESRDGGKTWAAHSP